MMPRGSQNLTILKMNMLGLGTKMIRIVMKDKNISSLEELIQSAIQQGGEVVACSMSMDVMGITEEELIAGVKISDVGYYLGQADQSSTLTDFNSAHRRQSWRKDNQTSHRRQWIRKSHRFSSDGWSSLHFCSSDRFTSAA